jgi:hypothetical protein
MQPAINDAAPDNYMARMNARAMRRVALEEVSDVLPDQRTVL